MAADQISQSRGTTVRSLFTIVFGSLPLAGFTMWLLT
jgi:hypothetical protein